MQRSVAITLVVLLLASSMLVGTTGATATERSALVQPEGFDETTFEITVYEDRRAQWTFEHRRALDNETELQRFRDFGETFEASETDLYRSFVNRSQSLVAVGTDATGRNMTALNHARSASIQELGQRQGVVRLSFTWTNFASQEGDRVVIGDVFEGGIPIGQDQRLVVRHGPNLSFASAQPDDYAASGETLETSDSITWFGEKRFADNRPTVVAQAGSQGSTPTEPGPESDPENDPESESDSNTVMFVGLLLIALVLVAGVAYQRGVLDRLPTGGDGPDDAGAAQSTAEPDEPAPPEPEVVSDRDRVKTLLTENGGRMKQVRIVDETEWSKSKVSMLLSEMEDDGEISKLRVGRENIVSLAGHEPDAAGSPFDDE